MPPPLAAGLTLRPTGGARCLVIEDDPLVRTAVGLGLRAEGHVTAEVADAATARQAVREQAPDLVVCDAVLPDAELGPLLGDLRAAAPDAPIVVMTAHATVGRALEAFRAGACDLILKPFAMPALCATVASALARTRLPRALAAARRDETAARPDTAIPTVSLAMRAALDLAQRAAAHPNVTVLLEGESGVGKGLVAQWIHAQSARRRGPFVTVSCAAIPEALLEAELFGHERGAFTGATVARPGLAAAADGGTLFLDEVGEVSAGVQAKLLYLIETRRYRPVGSATERSADIRIVAATNRDLAAATRDGGFREDLYYRLRVVPIRVPSLRERMGDLPVLVQQFLETAGQAQGRPAADLTPAALEILLAYPWPGNVRELRNVIERAGVVGVGHRIEVADLPAEIQGAVSAPAPHTLRPFVLPAGGTSLRQVERAFVVQALQRTGGNRTEAGRLLGLNRDGVRYRVRKFAIEDAEIHLPNAPGGEAASTEPPPAEP